MKKMLPHFLLAVDRHCHEVAVVPQFMVSYLFICLFVFVVNHPLFLLKYVIVLITVI